ncbi:unnamed protein product [Owenia fusiformis]|uniref:Luciferin 4-monooxygenase n=1 Tax=Owenia fusiformis TaxID=6347 RepID=A0A8J1U2R0_OWEFU|nr:unnamed protein product [Owenia fusiformis]
MVLSSILSDVAIPEDLSLSDFIFNKLDEYGTRVALVDGPSGRSYRYSEIKTLSRCIGSGLTQHGFRQGDVVCIVSSNLPEYVLALYGVVCIGGKVTTANPLYTEGELIKQLEDCKASFIITQSAVLPKVTDVAIKCSSVKKVFTFDKATGHTSLDELMRYNEKACPKTVHVDPINDEVLIPYSSGTTGLPKGVMLTHHNLISNTLVRQHPGVSYAPVPDDCTIAVLPMYHIYGIMAYMINGLYRGQKIVTMPRFNLEMLLSLIEKHKCTYLSIVPPIAVLMAKHPSVSKYDLSSLRLVGCGAAPLLEHLSKQLSKRLNIPPIRQGYGLTETSPATHGSPYSGWKDGSIGILLPNTQCKVVEPETEKELGVNEDGELWIKGPQVMKGYLNKPEETAKVIDREGFFHTGDIGHYDEEGHFYIVDRLKELIKYKGYQVAPAELENLLLSHPKVADAAVIGIPDEAAGEIPKAFVVIKPNETVSAENVLNFIEKKVSPQKRLRGGVQFIKQIPKSPSGKILRRILRSKYLEIQKKSKL